MGAFRLFLAARAAFPISTVWIAVSVVSVVFARRAIPVDFARFHAPRDIPIIEFAPIVAGCIVAGLLRPRLYEWERVAIRPVGLLCGLLTVAMTALSTLPVLLGASRLPEQVPWEFVLANVVTVTALAFAMTALLGATTGGILTLSLYIAACIAQNLWPRLAQTFPLGRIEDPDPHWTAALVVCLVAAGCTAYTRGASTWSHRRE